MVKRKSGRGKEKEEVRENIEKKKMKMAENHKKMEKKIG